MGARPYNAFAHPQIKATLAQIDQLTPSFELGKGDVQVLTTPASFYETLKSKIATAKSRIFLATLYIGKHEHELISTLESALAANENLQLYILTDALRGTREAPLDCCASLLAPLVTKFGSERVHLSMYHTPNLNGLRKQVIPQRFNEGWGLQHMKLYGFDDEIILSGANLSEDYFTNRQDRYMLFRSKPMTDYFFKIHQMVSTLSYTVEAAPQLPSKFRLVWPHSTTVVPEPTEDPATFVNVATRMLAGILKDKNSEIPSLRRSWEQPAKTHPEEEDSVDVPSPLADAATVVYPISQFSQLLNPDTSTEFTVVSRVLSMLGTDSFNWTLTAGYFNIHPVFAEKLLKSRPGHAQVITASPLANGFYQSPGVSGLLPGAYSLLARRFVAGISAADKSDSIQLLEWAKGVVNTPEGWSYHAKGLWITGPKQQNPCMTVIGSSNYTRRAYSHDLESNVLLVTRDEELQKQMALEVENLKQHTKPMQLADYDEVGRAPDWRQRLFIRFMGDKL